MKSFLGLLVVVSTFLCPLVNAFAQQNSPDASDLLPENTVVYLELQDLQQLKEKLSRSPVAELLNDNTISSQVETVVQESWELAEDHFGLSRGSLTATSNLPVRNLVVGAVAPRGKKLESFLIFTLDEPLEENRTEVRKQIYKLTGSSSTQADLHTDKIESLNQIGNDRKFYYYSQLDKVILSSSKLFLEELVERWNGQESPGIRPLAENRKFATIINRCSDNEPNRMAVKFFIDPVRLAQANAVNDRFTQTLVDRFPDLGLDGVLGFGGTIQLETDEFATLATAYLLLADPAKGAAELFHWQPSDYHPPAWVPADVAAYGATSWNVESLYEELKTIFAAVGATADAIDQILEDYTEKQTGLNFQKEILPSFTGKLIVASQIRNPVDLKHSDYLYGLELNSPTQFRKLLDRMLVHQTGNDNPSPFEIQKNDFAGTSFYQRVSTNSQPSATFAVIGNYLVYSPVSVDLLKSAIESNQGTRESMSQSHDFLDIEAKLPELPVSKHRVAIAFGQPSKHIQWMLEMLHSDDVQSRLLYEARTNDKLKTVAETLTNSTAPEFEQYESYFRPWGGQAIAEESGLFFQFFELKPVESE